MMPAAMSGADPALVWLIVGLLLIVAEVFAPGAFLVWIGLAAVGTGLLALLVTLVFSQQVIVFAVLAAVSIAIGLRLRGPRRKPVLNTPGAGLIGRPARVLAFEGREGRVRVGDSDWPARLAAGVAAPPADTLLVVVGVDGMMLVVGQHP
jgi:membrane protein implicated in regulation of membrane protease activity